ncbi:type-F conjugative transfer system pilin assembly protein TrbC [Xanthomonas hortorum]|uniref:Type-F conjugative transfer system pilin assembly protein TrbC n=1 Tax=Xanthomonas hortorum pv. hederae TaxID=453603 RepID=A0A9X3YZJ9_9XANT|nr:type-F conjugative transfer system pilin assembly protein TrbC [Xanthomonas hortorum]MDC8637159.1 type-F conjugative transfer system pilin assembly protein TrbC [Xanthomonas hortorum pv. hederae]
MRRPEAATPGVAPPANPQVLHGEPGGRAISGWRRFAAALALVSNGVLSALAHAQQPIVTEADVERARRDQPTITDEDIERARARYGQLPVEMPAASPRAPNLDALPVPLQDSAIDLGAVAEGYRLQAPVPAGLDEGPVLYLFVSLSMPEPALRRIIAQAAQARATVLIRGMSGGSLRQTAARLQALIGPHPVSIQIDPRPFEQFDIQRVPAFVLARPSANADCAGGSCPSGAAFVRATGDVSLDYALAHVQRTAPAWGPAAGMYLRRLEGRE